MNINTLTSTLAAAIANVGCIDHVYVNVDLENRPGEDECPYAIIYPSGKDVGQVQAQKVHGFEVIICVSDYNSSTVGKITTYDVVETLETTRKTVETAIVAAMPDNTIINFEIEYETLEQFPLALAGMSLQITESTVIGGDYLL